MYIHTDVEVPTIAGCPTDTVVIDILTSPEFPVPVPSDNDAVNNLVKSFEVEPLNFLPSDVLLADTTVTYTATDFYDNQETCVIDIRIKGKNSRNDSPVTDDFRPKCLIRNHYTMYLIIKNICSI